MDRNRPLPPGKTFDPIREREFLSRKERGFPYPEYFSFIPTPEANSTFQAERDKVWTDAMLGGDVYKYGKVDLNDDIYPEGSFLVRDRLSDFIYDPTEEEKKTCWHYDVFEYQDNFRLAPEVNYVRYIFENGEVGYAIILSSKVLTPPTSMNYKTEYIYRRYIETEEYYQEIWDRQKSSFFEDCGRQHFF
ncbi:hypothetical protein K5X82_11145 [Halosquirtibacter xylanolyticus]|uniref:hypothetical protein n=1 Tax=Halosquirtibacter xylanolyticus TaxID=3374599 RepID=UPI0037494C5B|nr:hypothetical protein K5X82_11145 [Prolixibacteraceae bacterium]